MDNNLSYVWICFKIILIIVLLIVIVIPTKEVAYFKFTNEKIHYSIFKENKNPDYVEIFDERTAYNKYIKQISFCIMAEPRKRYGRKHYLSSWKLFRKSAIAIPLTKLLTFILYLIEYLLVLPFKIYKLKKAKEPLSLLKKNIVIEFANRNYFIINIYSQKEFDELIRYFTFKKIYITDKTMLLHHWQVINPYFPDKEEEWCDDFEPQKIEKKTGIIKKIFGLFGDKK
jgi:hypothetical protein